MQAFKKYSSAVAANQPNRPIIRIDGLYIVLDYDHTQIELINQDPAISSIGHINGQVSVRHLQRLGNANWATSETATRALKEENADLKEENARLKEQLARFEEDNQEANLSKE